MPDSDPKTRELKIDQDQRTASERKAAETAELPDEERQHRRRADKAAYLREKLAEREEAERKG